MASFRVLTGAIRVFGKKYVGGKSGSFDHPLTDAKLYQKLCDLLKFGDIMLNVTEDEKAAFENQLGFSKRRKKDDEPSESKTE